MERRKAKRETNEGGLEGVYAYNKLPLSRREETYHMKVEIQIKWMKRQKR